MVKRHNLIVQCIFGLCLLVILACGGGGNGTHYRFGWLIDFPVALTGPAGTEQTFTVVTHRTDNSAHVYDISLSVTVDQPGWTVTVDPSSFQITPDSQPTAQVTVTIPADAPTGMEAFVTIKAAEKNRQDMTKFTKVTVGNALTTGMVKVSDFESLPDGLHKAEFRVENGAPGALVGSLLTQFVPNVMYWYRPDNTLSLGVNSTKDIELMAIPTDSTIPGPHTVEAKFEKAAQIYAASSNFTGRDLSHVAYKIQQIAMYVSNIDIGDEAYFQVTITVPAGHLGTYTLGIENLSAGLTAEITPPTAGIDEFGTPVTFDVVIRRTSAHPDQGYTTHELVIVGTHDTFPDANLRQVVPIFANP